MSRNLVVNGEIVLAGDIVGDEWAPWFAEDEVYIAPADVRSALWAMQAQDVTVRLNSFGGHVHAGEQVRAMFAGYPGKVTMIVEGAAYSAASLIRDGADHRAMTEGSTLMIHDPSGLAFGTEADMLKEAEATGTVARAAAAVYASATGKTPEECRAIMQAETWFDAPGAVAAGFAHEVVTGGALQMSAKPPALPDAANPQARFLAAQRSLNERLTNPALGRKPANVAMLKGAPVMESKQVAPGAETEKAPVISAAQTTADAVAQERAWAKKITDAVSMAGLPVTMAAEMIEANTSVEEATKILAAPGRAAPAAMAAAGSQPARVTVDAREKFVEGAGRALAMKVGLPKGERNEFSSMRLTEMARHALALNGVTNRFTDASEMVGQAFLMSGAGAMTTGDFANVLANLMGKSALVGWEEAQETYPLWTRKGTLTDFKTTKRVGVGAFAALPAVVEGANYTYGTVGDRGEPITLATYGRLLRISRQAILNDDLTLLGDLPRRMGRAAKRTVGNLAYAVLTGNPTMSDSVALFHATHANLAGTTGAPSVATLGAAKAAMLVQSDNGSALNIMPKYLIVPAALEMTAKQVIGSAVDPTTSKGMAMNPVNNLAEVIVDARLDAASTTAWFMTADPSAFDTVEVAFLDGNDPPYLEQQTQWSADGVEMKVRIDAAAIPLDYRTMYKNNG